MKRIMAAAAAAGMLFLTGCGAGGTIREGAYYEASGICPDAVAVTVNGRQVDAEHYLYWLARNCAWLEEELGGTVDWEEDRQGQTLGEYAKEMALENVVLYALVETWAEQEGVTLTEEDQADLEAAWQSQCEAAGGQEAYEQSLGRLGADRELAQSVAQDACLYRGLQARCASGEGGLAPEGEVEAFAAEQELVTVDYLRFGTGAADLAQARQQAAAALTALTSAGATAEAFAALDTQGKRGTLTYLPGQSDLGEAAESAIAALAEGQCSAAAAETEEGVWIFCRRAPDAAQAAELYLDELLRSAAQEADVSLSQACRDLDAGAFYTALTQPQDTAQTGAEPPEDQAESDGSTQEPGT